MPEGDTLYRAASWLHEELAGRTIDALWIRGRGVLPGGLVTESRALGKHVLIGIAPSPKPAPEGEKAAAEAPAAKSDAAKPAEEAPEEQPARFDPVRGRFGPGTAPVRQSPVHALEASYEASGDRAVLKELRRARRAK